MKKSNFNYKYSSVFGVFWLVCIVVGHGQGFRQSPLDSIYIHYERSISNKTLAGVEALLILNDRVVWHQVQGSLMLLPRLLLRPIASITSSP